MIAICFGGTAVTQDRSKVLFILFDGLCWNNTTLYNTTKFYKTPNLARSHKSAGCATGHFGKWHLGPELEGVPTSRKADGKARGKPATAKGTWQGSKETRIETVASGLVITASSDRSGITCRQRR